MKTNPRKIFILVILVCLSMAVSGQKNKGVTPVNLSVTIDDSVNQSGSVGIGSDLGGAYINGQQSVVAEFLSTGVFSFKSGVRTVNAYYGLPIDPVSQPLPASDSDTGVQILTFVKSTYLQTMTIGEQRCEAIAVNFDLSSAIRTIGYRAGRGTISNTGPSLVSHPDNDTWTIQSDSGSVCSAFDSNARVRDAPKTGKPGDTEHGRYFMPFKLVLTRQP
jgi:hypothetical protein